MSEKSKIWFLGDFSSIEREKLEKIEDSFDVVSNFDSLCEFGKPPADIDGVLIPSSNCADFLKLTQYEQILEEIPAGIVIVDKNMTIRWANKCLAKWGKTDDVENRHFYDLMRVENGLPDFCSITATLNSGRPSNSTIHCQDNRFFQIHCVPLKSSNNFEGVLVTAREVTNEVLQQQKLTAIHKAGTELADLTAEEVFEMEVEQRIELLKSNILHFSKDILNFDVVEIRLLGRETGQLMPLLSVGIEAAAAERPLYAKKDGYGVTGYVAATGNSYLCEDTAKDPLFIEGCKDAKSSLTVPLILYDEVIGTFNVESPEPEVFTDQDLQFLEIFSRDVAAALNTLELLVAQHKNTAQASAEAIHREVALPVDEILNDAVNVMETYIGHDPSVVDRLRRILQNARDIKELIYKVGQEMSPAEAVPAGIQVQPRPQLRGKRILVVDDDESVRVAAHSLLERFDCIVETAHSGSEAFFMVRNSNGNCNYDVIIAEIRLPDMSGFELFMKLKEVLDPVPLVLMTGFGYDPGHTIVKARQGGLLRNAVLYKPFRLDQLLEVIEGVIQALRVHEV